MTMPVTEHPSPPATGATIDVLVVEDHRAFAEALCMAVDLQPDMRCRRPASSAEDALAQMMEDPCPDVLLLDITLPGLDGVRAIRRFRERCPDVRIIVLSGDSSAQTLLAATDAGADGFLPKGCPFAQVLATIRHADGDVVAETMSLNRMIRHASTAGRLHGTGSRGTQLTLREFEILVLLADGMPVKQIARHFEMTVNTCRGHVASILAKFGVHSQLAAVVAAAREGMLPNLRSEPLPAVVGG